MFSRLREPFGRAGLIVAIVALVAATVGGAYAASSSKRQHKKKHAAGLSAKQKRQVRTIAKAQAKKLQGTGPAGPQGPKGEKGDSGANGANGADGQNGQNGEKGDKGDNGAGVSTEAEAPFGNCGEVEGVKIVSASGTDYVCNGAAGGEGPEGKPWTAGGTLPSGATETGSYSAFSATETENAFASISFPIRLASALDESHVILVGAAGGNPTCTGSAANPTAPSGYLCVYKFAGTVTPGGILDLEGSPGASTAGAILPVEFSSTNGFLWGAWAVTG
jgi:hypothetical protein